ncbi:alanine racemase [Treponema primitia]|uniref:alanine racemase n=1 Tax=Treponema primitia TaxID=88058 RepID=UPI0002554DE1|nr:alanine racemase [Treponema primitia]
MSINEFVDPTLIGYCGSYFRVDTDEVVRNFRRVQNYIGKDIGIIPVVKGNCYGYGLVPMAKLFAERCGAKLIANAAVCESVTLRKAGITNELFLIGGVPQHLLEAVVEYDLQIPLFESKTADVLNNLAGKAGKIAKVHLKIETGMNRLGVRGGKDLAALLDYMRNKKNMETVGIYTHFATSTADYNDPFALEQFGRFKEAVEQVKGAGISPKYIHCCNSAAIAWFKDAYCTHVRSGASVLGHLAMEDGREPIGLEESVSIRTFVTSIHNVYPGESVGYHRYFKVEKPMTIATLSIGFTDGIYPPWAKTQGPVLVSGKRTHFLGICMDQSFIDVTGIPCEIGQQVTLIGRDGDERIKTWDIERHTGQTFELLYGTIGSRVARVYISNGEAAVV